MASKDSRTFYFVVDGELTDADVGIDSFDVAPASVHFTGGKFTTDNLYLIEQLQTYVDTHAHPVTDESPRAPKKEGSS